MTERAKAIEARLISVVDDDESVRQALESLLKSVGFRVAVFTSAPDFCEATEFHTSDCLILDVRMPGMGGLALQKRLLEKSSPVPVVFISAHGERNEREQALANGAVAFLQKPFDDSSLLDSVGNAIKSKDGEGRK